MLTLAGLTTLAAALGAASGAPQRLTPQATILHVWSDEAGESHLATLDIAERVQSVPVTGMRIRPIKTDFVDWHPGGPSLACTIAGHLEVETTDGSKAVVPTGGLAFIDDRRGGCKGHITRPRGVVNLYLGVPDGFDVVAWARGD
jgi:hypothetical protein